MTLISLLVALVCLLIVAVVGLTWCLRRGIRSRATLANALRQRSGREAAGFGSIAFYGDSLTAGTGATPGRDYPTLVGAFFGVPFEAVAVGGATSSQLADLATRGRTPRVDVAVVWLGRNNFEEVDTVVADVDRVLGFVGADVCVRVLGVIPSNEADEHGAGSKARAIEQLNDQLASRYGAQFIDVGARLFGATGPGPAGDPVRSDHVHLNDRGYAVVAAEVIDSLLEVW